YPPSPDFVPEPVYLEFMPPEDEVLPAEEQPLLAATSPTANSPGYVPESDPEEDWRRMMMRTLRRIMPIILPTEETIAMIRMTVDHALSAEETKPFETDESAATPPPHPAYRVTARISIRDEPPTTFWSDTEVATLLAIPTPPPLPLSLWSSPLPQIPSTPLPPILSPLPVSPPLLVSSPPPASPIRIALGLRYEVGESSSAPTARPPRGFRADYGFVATIDREIMRDLKSDVGYGITDTWDEMLVDMPRAPATDDTELGRRMTEFTTRVRQDTDEIYTRLDDEQSERQLMAGRLNMLYRDSDLARAEVMSLRTQVVAQHAVIRELQATDRRRQAAITEMLAADRRRQAQFIEALKLLKRLQTQMTEFKR
ncbi:hypothetical protein Tco_1480687, partial [Tanacetum coccineum]